MGCDKISALRSAIALQFQSTHPHGVRLFKTDASDFPIPVSIHAPTWGATLYLLILLQSYSSFNPRTHMGCDWMSPAPYGATFVSIHAPTWGATIAPKPY